MTHRKTLGWLLAGLIGLQGSGWAAQPWLLAYRGQSTNQLVHDARLLPLLRTAVPAAMVADVHAGLGGPPDPVRVSPQGQVAASACMAHACMFKAWFWYDTRTGQALAALAEGGGGGFEVTLASRTLAPQALPGDAVQALKGWWRDQDIQPRTLRWMTASGRVQDLAGVAVLQPEPVVPRPAGGPSFDCAQARSRVEQAVCSAPDLAAQDRQLDQQFQEIRRALAREGDQQALRQFQRQWLQQRNRRCEAQTQLAACLSGQYAAQQEALQHWLPPR